MKDLIDLKSLVEAIAKDRVIILLSTLAFFVIFLFISLGLKTKHQVNQSLFINTKVNLPSSEISKNIYFNPPVKDPTETVIAIFNKTEIKNKTNDLSIEILKVAPQVIELRLQSQFPESLANSSKIIEEVDLKLNELTKNNDTNLSLEKLNQETVTTLKPPKLLFTLVGGLIGTILGVGMVLLKIYFSK